MLQFLTGLHRKCIGLVDERTVAPIRRERGRPRETIHQFSPDVLTTDRRLVPPESLVVVPFLERLRDIVDGDELRSLHPPDVRGDVLSTDILVGEFDEDALDERDDRCIAPVIRDGQAKIRPRRC